eukprot:5507064-Pleurochrysis_carterae.AAC.1
MCHGRPAQYENLAREKRQRHSNKESMESMEQWYTEATTPREIQLQATEPRIHYNLRLCSIAKTEHSLNTNPRLKAGKDSRIRNPSALRLIPGLMSNTTPTVTPSLVPSVILVHNPTRTHSSASPPMGTRARVPLASAGRNK